MTSPSACPPPAFDERCREASRAGTVSSWGAPFASHKALTEKLISTCCA